MDSVLIREQSVLKQVSLLRETDSGLMCLQKDKEDQPNLCYVPDCCLLDLIQSRSESECFRSNK